MLGTGALGTSAVGVDQSRMDGQPLSLSMRGASYLGTPVLTARYTTPRRFDGNDSDDEESSSRGADSDGGNAIGEWQRPRLEAAEQASRACALCARVLLCKLLHPTPVSRSAVERQREAWGAPEAQGLAQGSHVHVCVPCYEAVRDGRGAADSRRSASVPAEGGEGWLRTLHRTERAAALWPWQPVVAHESWASTLALAEL